VAQEVNGRQAGRQVVTGGGVLQVHTPEQEAAGKRARGESPVRFQKAARRKENALQAAVSQAQNRRGRQTQADRR